MVNSSCTYRSVSHVTGRIKKKTEKHGKTGVIGEKHGKTWGNKANIGKTGEYIET